MIWRLRAVNYPPSSFLFLKNRIESTAESITSIGAHYGVNGKQLSTQYKEHFSDYRSWDQLGHAQDWLLFENNTGESLSIADSWPDRLDDSCARNEWNWKPQYDLKSMTVDMLEQLSKKLL